MEKRSLIQLLNDGSVICAEGYLFELERRGYLQAGAFVPEVVLEHPDVVLQLHREFVRAGTDIVEAFTYYAHREKLKLIDKEHLLEPMQKKALELAHQAANEVQGEKPLVAGNICNTNAWDPNDPEGSAKIVRPMFEEQIRWAAETGVDLIIAETFSFLEEAKLAVDVIKKETNLPSVVTIILSKEEATREGADLVEMAQQLEQTGAEVIGLNCGRGPATIWESILKVREAVKCHVACLPVPYRTSPQHPTFQSLRDPGCGCLPSDMPFPVALDPFTCNRYEIGDFAKKCVDHDIRYVGVCCGGAPHHVRSIAEALGRRPSASRFSPDMSKHYAYGTDSKIKGYNQEYTSKIG